MRAQKVSRSYLLERIGDIPEAWFLCPPRHTHLHSHRPTTPASLVAVSLVRERQSPLLAWELSLGWRCETQEHPGLPSPLWKCIVSAQSHDSSRSNGEDIKMRDYSPPQRPLTKFLRIRETQRNHAAILRANTTDAITYSSRTTETFKIGRAHV